MSQGTEKTELFIGIILGWLMIIIFFGLAL